MQAYSLSLMDLLHACLQEGTDNLWAAFLGRLDAIISPGIAGRLARGRASCGTTGPETDRREELRDVKQEVYLRLVAGNCRVLRRLHGVMEQSLRGYLLSVARNVVKDYLRRPAARTCAMCSLDSLPEKWETGLNLVSRDDIAMETALWVREAQARISDGSERDAAARDGRILKLWMQGFSLAEISRCPGITISKQAIGKVVAKQKRVLKGWLGGQTLDQVGRARVR